MHWDIRMTDRRDMNEDGLETLFAQARAAPPPLPEGLMARVLADAEAVRPRAGGPALRRLLAAIGGLPALGGLITATCVGFWIGAAAPLGLPDLGAEVFGQQDVAEEVLQDSFLTAFGWDNGEG